MTSMKSLLAGAALAASLAVPSFAAQAPSADDIIKSLTPTGSVGSSTRGIRPSSGGAPAAAPAEATAPAAHTTGAPHQPATKTASAGAQASPASPSASLEVQFATNSAELTPSARATLDQLGKALSSNDLAGYKFRIEGHTDTVGTADMNQSLSARRADAVVAYLIEKFHIDATHLQAVGMGQDGLAVATGPQVPEQRNRRVVVVNLGA